MINLAESLTFPFRLVAILGFTK